MLPNPRSPFAFNKLSRRLAGCLSKDTKQYYQYARICGVVSPGGASIVLCMGFGHGLLYNKNQRLCSKCIVEPNLTLSPVCVTRVVFTVCSLLFASLCVHYVLLYVLRLRALYVATAVNSARIKRQSAGRGRPSVASVGQLLR